MAVKSYTIQSVSPIRGGYKIDYGSGTINIYSDEYNSIPSKGQKIVLDGKSVTIAGRRIR